MGWCVCVCVSVFLCVLGGGGTQAGIQGTYSVFLNLFSSTFHPFKSDINGFSQSSLSFSLCLSLCVSLSSSSHYCGGPPLSDVVQYVGWDDEIIEI